MEVSWSLFHLGERMLDLNEGDRGTKVFQFGGSRACDLFQFGEGGQKKFQPVTSP